LIQTAREKNRARSSFNFPRVGRFNK